MSNGRVRRWWLHRLTLGDHLEHELELGRLQEHELLFLLHESAPGPPPPPRGRGGHAPTRSRGSAPLSPPCSATTPDRRGGEGGEASISCASKDPTTSRQDPCPRLASRAARARTRPRRARVLALGWPPELREQGPDHVKPGNLPKVGLQSCVSKDPTTRAGNLPKAGLQSCVSKDPATSHQGTCPRLASRAA